MTRPGWWNWSAQASSGLEQHGAAQGFDVFNPSGTSFPVVSIDIQQDSSFGYQLEAVIAGPPAQTFQWSTSDTSNIIFLNFLDENIGVTVTDSNNNTALGAV